MEKIIIKRAYNDAEPDDGYRILVDRLWPRGISKEEIQIEEWVKEIAPSHELRKWFGHQPALFDGFKEKYKKELENQRETLSRLRDLTNEQKICLVYGAKDEEHNQAVVLKEVLESV